MIRKEEVGGDDDHQKQSKPIFYFIGKVKDEFKHLPIEPAQDPDPLFEKDEIIRDLRFQLDIASIKDDMIEGLEKRIAEHEAHLAQCGPIAMQEDTLEESSFQVEDLHKDCIPLGDFSTITQFTVETLDRLSFFAQDAINRERESSETVIKSYETVIGISDRIKANIHRHLTSMSGDPTSHPEIGR
jgi:hypothetical protein